MINAYRDGRYAVACDQCGYVARHSIFIETALLNAEQEGFKQVTKPGEEKSQHLCPVCFSSADKTDWLVAPVA